MSHMDIRNTMCSRRNVESPSHAHHPESTPSRHDNHLTGNVHGTSLQAGAIHGDVHISTVTSSNQVTPRQLPTPTAVYLDRPQQVARINAAITRAHSRERNALIVVTGPAGVGKSALATHFLHANAGLGREGQLFVDLRGFSSGPSTDPHEVLETLLHAMGVDLRSIPSDLSARAAWWRSTTSGKRIALLLDNALSGAQVRALLPGGGHSTVIVTSRAHLTGLRMDGAEFVEVAPMPGDEGVELLSRLGGRLPDTDDERSAMRRIVDLCAGLPVAMCAVAIGDSAHHRRSWKRIERGLRNSEDRLARLSMAGEPWGPEVSVRGAFDVSYEMLNAEQARLYRRLAWHPGPDLTTLIASCLVPGPQEEVDALLTDLSRQAMLFEYLPGRYRFHDLLHLHAAAKARKEELPWDHGHAVEELLSTFGDLSIAADTVLRPYARTTTVVGASFTTQAEATAWLHAERENLAALIDHAVETGRFTHALRLVEGMWPLFLHHGHASLWLRAVDPAITAARVLGERRTEGRLLNKRARGHRRLGRSQEALADLDRAEVIWREVGDLKRIALTRQQRGTVALQAGRPQEAIAHFRRTLAMDEKTEDEHNMAITLLMLGRAYLAVGLAEQALSHLERALPLLTGDPYNQARTRVALGSALSVLGQSGRARQELDSALEVMIEHGSVSGRCEALEALGDLAVSRGDTGTARELYEQVLGLLPPTDPARLRVEQRLTGLGRK